MRSLLTPAQPTPHEHNMKHVNGHVIVNVILDHENDMLGEPWVETRGLSEMGYAAAPLVDLLEEDLSQFIGRAGGKTRGDDDKMEQALKRVVRQICQAEIGKSPEVTVLVSRLM